jgi:hypothetical protein
MKLFDYPVQLLDPQNDFGWEIQDLFPDLEFTDKTNGFDFTVKDGKADDDLRFDLAPISEMSNYINVKCVDGSTGEPLEGVELSLIEAPDTYAKTVRTAITDETGLVRFDKLRHAGPDAYLLKVDKTPDGYTGGFDHYFSWGYVYEYEDGMNYYFYPVKEPETISVNDICTYEIWQVISEKPDHTEYNKVYSNVASGEKVDLKNGKYVAVLDLKTARENNCAGVRICTDNGTELERDLKFDDFTGDTAMVSFFVDDGRADRSLVFYANE